MWTLPSTGPLEARIVALAEAQYGVVAVAQLEAMGLSASAARSRVAAGRLTASIAASSRWAGPR